MLQCADGTCAYTTVLTETNSYASNIALCLFFAVLWVFAFSITMFAY